MKCSECAEYKACSRKYDLRIRRRRCGKTDTAKYVVMEEGGGMTKDEITTPLRDAEQEGVKRLRELAKADKEGRVAVLPCEVGGSMLNTIDIERPRIMKGLHFAVAYESVRGTIFYVPYDIFREYIDAGHVQPLHKLKEAQNGKSKLD